jgi:type IV secretory pathway ATPase VirB11/archaellum biosynthesis ATPase
MKYSSTLPLEGERHDHYVSQGYSCAGLVSEELRRAIAVALRDAHEYASITALAEQYGQPLELSAEEVFSTAEFDRLLDPLASVGERFQLFERFLRAAVASHRIAGLDDAPLDSQAELSRLFDETLGWGEPVRHFLADERCTKLTVAGTKALASAPDFGLAQQWAYATTLEVLRWAEFLMLATGGSWNRASPLTCIEFLGGTRVTLVREPLVSSPGAGHPGLLVMIERARTAPSTLGQLVEQARIDRPAAVLLAALLHARCSCILSGPAGTGKNAVVEALLGALPRQKHILALGRLPGVTFSSEGITVSAITTSANDSPEQAQIELLRALVSMDTVVVATEGDSDVALALEQSEAGVQTLISVDAVTPALALERLRRCRPSHGVLAGTEGEGWRSDAGAALQLLIQAAFSQRLQHWYISDILAVSSVPGQGLLLVPLIEATVEVQGITWTGHAELRDQQLCSKHADAASYAALNRRLADLPDYVWTHLSRDPLAQLVSSQSDCDAEAGSDGLEEEPAAPRISPLEIGSSSTLGWLDAALQRNRERQRRPDTATQE